jgi:hypothetical protein
MKAKEFDKKFDDGQGIMEHLDMTTARRPGREQEQVNVAPRPKGPHPTGSNPSRGE